MSLESHTTVNKSTVPNLIFPKVKDQPVSFRGLVEARGPASTLEPLVAHEVDVSASVGVRTLVDRRFVHSTPVCLYGDT